MRTRSRIGSAAPASGSVVANGLAVERVTGMLFDQFATMALAAHSCLGVAVSSTFLVEPELRWKELAPVVKQLTRSQGTYRLVQLLARDHSPPLSAFRNWLERFAQDMTNAYETV